MQVALKGILTSAECGVRVQAERTTPSAEAAATPPKTGGEFVLVTAQAGEDWDAFVDHCVSRDLAGVECLSGIPGFVGGTPVQNVGAYGQEVSETIVSVRAFDRTNRQVADLSNADCGFAYRTSIFNTTDRDHYIVLSVTYSLRKGGPPKIAYKDLKEFFAGREPALAETRQAVLSVRSAKSMVIDPNDPNSQSAGSFFKNPIIGREMLAEIEDAFPEVPHFDVDTENVKVAAAWLIENAGFYKGFAMGNAGISTKHSLAIVNRGNATAADVIALRDRIVSEVNERFGIELRPEPIFVGFD